MCDDGVPEWLAGADLVLNVTRGDQLALFGAALDAGPRVQLGACISLLDLLLSWHHTPRPVAVLKATLRVVQEHDPCCGHGRAVSTGQSMPIRPASASAWRACMLRARRIRPTVMSRATWERTRSSGASSSAWRSWSSTEASSRRRS